MYLNCPRQTPSPQKESERAREREPTAGVPSPDLLLMFVRRTPNESHASGANTLLLLFLPQRKRKGTLIVDQVWSSPPPYINLYTHLLKWFKAHYVRTESQQLRIKAFLVKSVLQKKQKTKKKLFWDLFVFYK